MSNVVKYALDFKGLNNTLIRRTNGRSLGTFKSMLFQVFGELLTEEYF